MDLSFNKYSNDYLIKISKNKELLHKEIKDTKYYVLQLLDEAKIYPDLAYFWEEDYSKIINLNTLPFIVHNYDLTKGQKLYIMTCLNHKQENVLLNEKLSEDDLLSILPQSGYLPKNFDVSFNFLKENSSAIIKSKLNNKEQIVQKAIDEFLTLDEFLMLDNKLVELTLNYNFSKNIITWFNSSAEAKAKIKTIILEKNRFIPETILGSLTYDITDKDFLLRNIARNMMNFEDIQKYPSISNVVSLADWLSINLRFFDNKKSFDVHYFNSENENEVREVIRENILDNEGVYFSLFDIVKNTDEDLDYFKKVYSEDFILQLMKDANIIGGYLQNDILDSEHSFRKINYLLEIIFKNINNEKEYLEKFSFPFVARISSVGIVSDENQVRFEKLLKENLDNLFENKKFVTMFSNDMFNLEIVKLIEEYSIKNPSINLFIYCLKNYTSSNKENFPKEIEIIENIVSNITQKLNMSELKELSSINEHRIIFNSNMDTDSPNPDKNILQINPNEINDYPLELTKFLIDYSPSFREKLLNSHSLVDSKNAGYLFNHLNVSMNSFFLDYLNKYKDQIKDKKDWKVIVDHHPEIFLNQDTLVITKNIEEIINIGRIGYDIKKQFTNIKKKYNLYGYDNEEGFYEHENLSEEEKLYNEFYELCLQNIKSFNEKISLLTKENKIKFINELFEKKDFEIIYYMVNQSSYSKETKKIFDIVLDLPFKKLMAYTQNSVFREIIQILGSENKFRSNNNFFTNITNKNKAKELYTAIKTKNKTKNRNILSLLNPKKVGVDLIKDIIVENSDTAMYYGRKYQSNCFDATFEIGAYSFEQVIKIFNNALEDGLFKNMSSNDKEENFIEEYLYYNNKNNFSVENYYKLLSYAKENSPVLYVILSHRKFLEKPYSDIIVPEKTNVQEYRATKFFHDNIDVNVIVKGMEQIYEMIEKHKNDFNFNTSKALLCLSQIVYSSYYEMIDYSTYSSSTNLSEYQSRKIIDFFLKNEPILLASYSCVGNVKENLLEDPNNVLNIEKLLFPNIMGGHNKIHNNSKDILKGAISSIIDRAYNDKNIKLLSFIKYVLEQDRCHYVSKNELNSETLTMINSDDEIIRKLSTYQEKHFFDNDLVNIVLSGKKKRKL